jgi:hypothetical protein
MNILRLCGPQVLFHLHLRNVSHAAHRDSDGAKTDSSDPADWNRASYLAHPVDVLEPLTINPSDYREAALHFVRIMFCVDTFIAASRDARLASIQVSIALGWPSTRGKTETSIAAELDITKQALSRGVAKFLRMTRIEPAFGLKSNVARRKYQSCH